jgi:hypothetical protein
LVDAGRPRFGDRCGRCGSYHRHAGQGHNRYRAKSGPDDLHVVDRNASATQPAKFLVFLIKDGALSRSCQPSDCGVSANPSEMQPGRLFAVFIVDRNQTD